jgi:hypothetical protein
LTSAGSSIYLPAMKLYTTALVVAWLLLPLPLAAQGPIAVPGTADVGPAQTWELLLPPPRPLSPSEKIALQMGAGVAGETDLKAPLSQWTIIKTFPSEKKCHAGASDALQEYHAEMQGAWAQQMAQRLKNKRPGVVYGLSESNGRSLQEEQTLRCIASDDPRLKK